MLRQTDMHKPSHIEILVFSSLLYNMQVHLKRLLQKPSYNTMIFGQPIECHINKWEYAMIFKQL